MDVIVIDSEAYKRLVADLRKMMQELLAEMKQDEWLSPEEAKKLLGIKSKSKLQKLRDTGEILFSQHGRIIKYSRQSINKFLMKYVPKFH